MNQDQRKADGNAGKSHLGHLYASHRKITKRNSAVNAIFKDKTRKQGIARRGMRAVAILPEAVNRQGVTGQAPGDYPEYARADDGPDTLRNDIENRVFAFDFVSHPHRDGDGRIDYGIRKSGPIA